MFVYIIYDYCNIVEKIFDNEPDAIDYCAEWNKDEDANYWCYYLEHEPIKGKFTKIMKNGDYYYWMKKVE